MVVLWCFYGSSVLVLAHVFLVLCRPDLPARSQPHVDPRGRRSAHGAAEKDVPGVGLAKAMWVCTMAHAPLADLPARAIPT